MGLEIERKFLVDKRKWDVIEKPEKEFFKQGYLLTDPDKTIRVRQTGSEGYITIKGRNSGAVRIEYEFVIPADKAGELIEMFSVSVIIKYRYKVNFKNKSWEVDEFLGDNKGLLVAEIELSDENEEFDLPEWIGKEVTGEEKYYNSKLSENPFMNWDKFT